MNTYSFYFVIHVKWLSGTSSEWIETVKTSDIHLAWVIMRGFVERARFTFTTGEVSVYSITENEASFFAEKPIYEQNPDYKRVGCI